MSKLIVKTSVKLVSEDSIFVFINKSFRIDFTLDTLIVDDNKHRIPLSSIIYARFDGELIISYGKYVADNNEL